MLMRPYKIVIQPFEQEIKQIGHGAYGSVYLIERDGKYFAKKKILASLVDEQNFDKEAKILRGLNHRYIVRCVEVNKDQDYYNIVTEYCERGDLQKQLNERKNDNRQYEEPQIVSILEQTLEALEYIHKEKIIHRDLKPANIFLKSDNQIAIGDFGVSRSVLNSQADGYSNQGTQIYQSYQMLNDQQYSKKTDIWSLGVTIYQLCQFDFPFNPKPRNDQCKIRNQQLVLAIEQNQVKRIDKIYSDALWELILSMLQKEESKRPDASELLGKIVDMKMIINSKEYITKGKRLGSGGFGVVDLIQYKTALFACKTIELSKYRRDQNKSQRFLSEVEILKKLRHDNVLEYVEAEQKGDKLFIVTEYCSSKKIFFKKEGDLARSVIRRCLEAKSLLSEAEVMGYFVQIVLGLAYMHNPIDGNTLGIIHRDLKPSNIFIRFDGTLAIGDFGLSKLICSQDPSQFTSPIGTYMYSSPEVLKGEPYGVRSDIWSLGVILFELCTGNLPFIDDNKFVDSEQDNPFKNIKIWLGCIEKYDLKPVPQSNEMNALIQNLLQIEGESRPTSLEILKIPFVQKYSNRHQTQFSPTRQQIAQNYTAQVQMPQQIVLPQQIIRPRTIEDKKAYLQRKLKKSFDPAYLTASLKYDDGLQRQDVLIQNYSQYQQYVETVLKGQDIDAYKLFMRVYDLVVEERTMSV